MSRRRSFQLPKSISYQPPKAVWRIDENSNQTENFQAYCVFVSPGAAVGFLHSLHDGGWMN